MAGHMVIKTFYLKNTSGAPEDRFTGEPAYIGQRYMIRDFPAIVIQTIKSQGNQVVVLDFES